MIRFKQYEFSPTLVPSLVMLITFPFLISLGVWQLNRADEKREIDNGVINAQTKPALRLNNATNENLLQNIYRSASMLGHYDNQHQFLYDNRTHKGRPGYHVLTPFLLKNTLPENEQTNKAVLVNRGWIPYHGTRENIPDINVSENSIIQTGVIKKVSQSIVLNNAKTDYNKKYPQVIQAISLTDFNKVLKYNFLPIVIELDKTEKHGFTREWQAYYGSVDKHLAYAMQWFAMAAILLFLYLKLNTKKNQLTTINNHN